MPRLNDLINTTRKQTLAVPSETEFVDPVIVTHGLMKKFGATTVLSDCFLEVAAGEVFGLLGPNGAGKSTLIRCLLGFLKPTAGSILVAGLNPQTSGVALRTKVSYLPGDARLPHHMRGRNVLKFFSQMHPEGDFQRSLAIAERLELNTMTPVAMMSTGMRQKLALSIVLGNQCQLIILDEPTANLDPTIRGIVMEMVRENRAEGRTVVFSSHVMSEIEDVCDRVVFLREGHIVHELTMPNLLQQHRITADPVSQPVVVPTEFGDRVRVQTIHRQSQPRLCIDTRGDVALLLDWLSSLKLSNLRIEPLGLRSVYESVHRGEEVPC